MAKVKYQGASMQVLSYLRKNPNTVIPHVDIMRELHYPASTVSNAISHLISSGISAITRPSRGMVIYSSAHMTDAPVKPNLALVTPSTAKMFEFIGYIGDEIMIRSETEDMYVATPLEVWAKR